LPLLTKEHDVGSDSGTSLTGNEGIKMEVGIEDCLHIEFEYDRRVHHLQDTGKFTLLKERIKDQTHGVGRHSTRSETSGAASHCGQRNGSTNATMVDASNLIPKHKRS
jgi:vacuolar protein sorting-associated protein 26